MVQKTLKKINVYWLDDTDREKIFVSLEHLEEAIAEQLEAVRKGIYEKALNRRQEMTFTASTFDEMKDIAEHKPGFIKAMWCGDLACEEKIKEEAGLSSRCIPLSRNKLQIHVYAAVNLQNPWCIGVNLINQQMNP